MNAFEIQCMFEGLLDRKNILSFSDNPKHIDTSDEEPIAKIPKYNESIKFSSQKDNNKKSSKCIASDIDADSENSEGDMEFVEPKSSDCVDSVASNILSSKTKIDPPNQESTIVIDPFVTPSKVTVVKRSKDFSKFHRSNRKSKNCAIFYYKHIDTDNDQNNDNNGHPLVSSEASEEEIWEYSNNLNDTLNMDAEKTKFQVNELTQQQNLSMESNTSQVSLFIYTHLNTDKYLK